MEHEGDGGEAESGEAERAGVGGSSGGLARGRLRRWGLASMVAPGFEVQVRTHHTHGAKRTHRAKERHKKKGYPACGYPMYGAKTTWIRADRWGRPGCWCVGGASATHAASTASAGATVGRTAGSWTTLRAGSAARTAGAFAEATVAELGPLVGGEHAANAEQHLGVGLLQVGAGLGDLIDLGRGLGDVQRVRAEHGFQHHLRLFKAGLQVDELEAALLEDVVHLLGLVSGEGEALDDHGVLPPHAFGADVEAHAAAFLRTPMETAARAAAEAAMHHLGAAAALGHSALHHSRTALHGWATHAGVGGRSRCRGCWGSRRCGGRWLLSEGDGTGESQDGKHGQGMAS